ncbi:hypothetical protein ACO0SA_000475 [Hanseniaspora valbyensis]
MSNTNNQESDDNSNHNHDQQEDDDINFADLVSNILMNTEDQNDNDQEEEEEEEEEEEGEDVDGQNDDEDNDEGHHESYEQEEEDHTNGNNNNSNFNQSHSIEQEPEQEQKDTNSENEDNDLNVNINHLLRNSGADTLNRRDSVLGDVNNQEWLKLLQNDIRRGSVSVQNANNTTNIAASQRRQSIGGNDADDAFLTNAILQSLKNMNTEGTEQNQDAIEDEQADNQEDNNNNDNNNDSAAIDNMQLVDDVLQDILMQGTTEDQQQQQQQQQQPPPQEIAAEVETAVTERLSKKKKKQSKKKKKISSQDDDLQALINQVVSNTLQEHAQLGSKSKSKTGTSFTSSRTLQSTQQLQQQQLQHHEQQLQRDASKKKKSTSSSSKKKRKKADDLDIAKIMKDAMSLAKTKQPGEEQAEKEGHEVDEEGNDHSGMRVPLLIQDQNQHDFNLDDLGLNLDQLIENTMQPIILQEQASRHQLIQQQQLQVQQRLQAIAKQKALERKQQKEEARAARRLRREAKQRGVEEEKKKKKLAKIEKKKARLQDLEQEKVQRIEKKKQKEEMKIQQKTLKAIEKDNRRKIKEAEKLARKLRRDQRRQLKEKKLAAQQQAAASGLKPTSFITQKLKTGDSTEPAVPAYKARLAQLRNLKRDKTSSSDKLASGDNIRNEFREQILTPTAALLEKYNIPQIPTVDELGNPLSVEEIKQAEQKALRRLQKERAKEIQRKERERTKELRRLQKEELKRFREEEKNRRMAYFKQMKREQEKATGIKAEDDNDENFVPGVTEDAVRRAISLNLKPNKSLTTKKRKRDESGTTTTNSKEHSSKKQKLSKEESEAKKKAKLEKEERRRLRREKKKANVPGLNVMKMDVNPTSETNLAKTASATKSGENQGSQMTNITDKNGKLHVIKVFNPDADSDLESGSDSDIDEESFKKKKKKSKSKKSKRKARFYTPPSLSALTDNTTVISKNALRLTPVVLKGPPFPWYLRLDKLGVPKLPLAKNNSKSSLIRKQKYEVKKEIDLNGRDLATWEKYKRYYPTEYKQNYEMYIREIQKALLRKFGRDVTIDLDLGIIENGEVIETSSEKAHPPFIIPEIPVYNFGENMVYTIKYGNVSKNWLQTLENENEILEILGNDMNLLKNLKVTWFNKELSQQMKIRNEIVEKERVKETAIKAEYERTRRQLKEQRRAKLLKKQNNTPLSAVMSISKHKQKSSSKESKPTRKQIRLLMNTPQYSPVERAPPSGNFDDLKPIFKTHLETEMEQIKNFYNNLDVNSMTAFMPIIKAYYVFQMQWISKFQTVSLMRRFVAKIAKNYHKQFEVEKQVLNYKAKLKDDGLQFFLNIVKLIDDVVISFLNNLMEEKKKTIIDKMEEKEDGDLKKREEEEAAEKSYNKNLKRVNKGFLEEIFIISMKDAIKASAADTSSGFLNTVKLDNLDFLRKKGENVFKINEVNENEIQTITSRVNNNSNSSKDPLPALNIISSTGGIQKPVAKPRMSLIKAEPHSNDTNFKTIATKIEDVSKQLAQNGATSNGAKKVFLVKEMFFKRKFDIPPRENLKKMKVMMKRIQTKVSTELFKKYELEYKNERMRRYRAVKNKNDRYNIYSEINGKITDNELLNLLVYIQGDSTALVEEILSDMRADSVEPAKKKPKKESGEYIINDLGTIKEQITKNEKNKEKEEQEKECDEEEKEKDEEKGKEEEGKERNNSEPLIGEKRSMDQVAGTEIEEPNKKQKLVEEEEEKEEEKKVDKETDPNIDSEVDPSLANM